MVLTMLACNAPQAVDTLPTATPPPTTTDPTPTIAEGPTPTATQGATPTTEAAGPNCVEPGGIPVPDPLPGVEALPGTIASYLSAGGSVTALRQAMREAGRITTENGMVDDTLDFNADGFNDVLITYIRTEAPGFGPEPPGVLVLYQCDEGIYTPIVQHNITGADADSLLIPKVLAARDINGVPGAEILYHDGMCGAHTCYETLHGYTTDGAGGAKPLFEENFNGPYPSFQLEQRDDDDVTEIVVQGGAIGSAGAGPQRSFEYLYDWNGSAYVVDDIKQTSPSHPIHVVMDADELLLKGELERALEEYERSYTDDSLELFGGEEAWPLDELEAYARYRRILAFLQQGDLNAAQAEDLILQSQFPDTEGADFAQTLLSTYETEGQQLGPACEAVVASIPEGWQGSTPLNSFGYANTYYAPADMCPFTGG
jgi:hypothetical protein